MPVELTDTDVKLLDFIAKNSPASIASIHAKFQDVSSIEYRVLLLERPEYKHVGSGHFSIPIDNSSYITEDVIDITDESGITKQEPQGVYRLTPLGEKALQDYKLGAKDRKRELWIKNAWIPIIVAFATTLLTNYILPRLLQLLESLFHTP